MSVLFKHIRRALAITSLMLFFISCSSYNRQINNYYSQVASNNYEKAASTLDQTRLLKVKRNRLLYLLEKGKMSHLLKQYEISNRFFNEADLYIEDGRTTAGDIVLGTLLNPMMQSYKGEDFEKFMVHYYKSLNYMYLGQTNEAIVEAKRISLRSYAQQDKVKNPDKYGDDAFALMLQGIIYEAGKEMNNAFISYRNAANIFIENNHSYYGVEMPEQLKRDLVRTAFVAGFTDELERYEKLLDIKFDPQELASGGELVLFWENGLAPVKREQNFFFSLTKDGLGNFAFIDDTGSFNIPFDYSSGINRNDLKVEDLRSFRVAFPRYEEQPVFFQKASLKVNEASFHFEAAENINALAFATLKERFIKDMSLALSRLAVKKLAEEAARPKKDDKNKDEKEAIAIALQIFSFASEKADTRNWQTLPHTIYYARVPLKKGLNEIDLQFSGASSHSLKLSVEGTGGLQIQNISTLR